MFKFIKRYSKDIIVSAAIFTAGYFLVQEVRGWYAFRQTTIVNTAIIQKYFANDNPKLLGEIVGKPATPPTQPVKPQPTATPEAQQ